jgi:hypothetical protein
MAQKGPVEKAYEHESDPVLEKGQDIARVEDGSKEET